MLLSQLYRPYKIPFPAILVFFLAGFYIPPVCYQSPLLHELQALKARHDGRAWEVSVYSAAFNGEIWWI